MKNSNFYRDALLEHYKNPKNLGSLENPDLSASAYNPLCGDELELNIQLYKENIKNCKTKVRGCSICIVSASMMSEQIIRKTLSHAAYIRETFLECLKNGDCVIPEHLEDLRPLISLKDHRSRVKCISLAWDALNDCLCKFEK